MIDYGMTPSFVIGIGGFLGAYTTFSTFSYETLRLMQDHSMGAALLNITGSVILGLVGVVLGVWLGKFFVG